MRLTYLVGAREDLRQIKAYYRSVAPEAVAKIRADIRSSLDLIALYPYSAPQVPGETFRRRVTRSYRFKIVYEVRAEEVAVAGIFRFQDRDV
jgi:plasmid stabilization system protein ParE